MVLFCHKTVRDGERVAIWSPDGSVNVVDGPRRVLLICQTVEPLERYFASHTEYLQLTKKDGTIHIIPGPTSLFINPLTDESIQVNDAQMIDASEALVVYRHSLEDSSEGKSKLNQSADGTGKSVERRIVRGPARFIPRADEWIHQFEWSGMPANGSKTSYQPKVLKFTQLRVIPASAYHNVSEVRTNDDTLITVKLMLFFELKDIEKMLDATNDPIGDFINAASADVIAFCATLNYETFLNETHKLNELSTFGQLCIRAQQIGYEITKVVFRGFQAGEKLQSMHDDAIQERTRLRLREQTEEQEQRQADMKLAAEYRRESQQAELESKQAAQKAQLSMVAVKASLEQKKLADIAEGERLALKHEQEMANLKAKGEAELEIEVRKLDLEVQRNAETLKVMQRMKELGVDLTKILVAQHEVPDKVIKLDAGENGASGLQAKGLMNALRLHM